MRDSLKKWADWNDSVISEVNAAYTSQTDAATFTLLGKRDGDRFIRHTGVVIQADCNAAKAILYRGTDKEITRYMKAGEVQAVLLRRTAMFLKLEGKLHPVFCVLRSVECKGVARSSFKSPHNQHL